MVKSPLSGSQIIALNPPNEEIQSADFNVVQNGAELWLPLLVSSSAGTGGESSRAR